MASLNRTDYERLFAFGRMLYENHTNRAFVREIATSLMAMSESVIGQQAGWPCIARRYRHLTVYDGAAKRLRAEVVDIRTGGKAK